MKQSHKNVDELNPVFLKISPNDIVYLKAILESYDELGVLRTLDEKNGYVVILSLPGLKSELDELLKRLRSEIAFTRVEPPSEGNISEDWLLEGEF